MLSFHFFLSSYHEKFVIVLLSFYFLLIVFPLKLSKPNADMSRLNLTERGYYTVPRLPMKPLPRASFPLPWRRSRDTGFAACICQLHAAGKPPYWEVQVSLWYILIGYFGGLSIYHNDTWTLWERCNTPYFGGRPRIGGCFSFAEPHVAHLDSRTQKQNETETICQKRDKSKTPKPKI